MPNYDNNHIKGDLYITFDVEFPRGGLSDSEKDGRLWLDLRNKLPYTHTRSVIYKELKNPIRMLNSFILTLKGDNKIRKIDGIVVDLLLIYNFFLSFSALKTILKQESLQKAYNGL